MAVFYLYYFDDVTLGVADNVSYGFLSYQLVAIVLLHVAVPLRLLLLLFCITFVAVLVAVMSGGKSLFPTLYRCLLLLTNYFLQAMGKMPTEILWALYVYVCCILCVVVVAVVIAELLAIIKRIPLHTII